MTIIDEARHKAKLIRAGAIEGSTPRELAKRFCVSRSYIYQVLRNEKCRDPRWVKPRRINDFRDSLTVSKIRLAQALGFSIAKTAKAMKMSPHTVGKHRHSKLPFNASVSLMIEIEHRPEDGLFGLYRVSAVDDSFAEVILVDQAKDADIVPIEQLYGRVGLVGAR